MSQWEMIQSSDLPLEPAFCRPSDLLPKRERSPEENLMIAIMDDAFLCAAGAPASIGCKRRRRKRRWTRAVAEAVAWFESDARHFYSFLMICEHFEWACDRIRAELQRRVEHIRPTPPRRRYFRDLGGRNYVVVS